MSDSPAQTHRGDMPVAHPQMVYPLIDSASVRTSPTLQAMKKDPAFQISRRKAQKSIRPQANLSCQERRAN
ncbi:hypothetical protein TWF718_006266 [Orbilia javanica]|uniref:Uncharacterized protein n=1 Tax=Orbilia javanica TaxID=47235 RepID=A0AAN8RK47_9PEZI